MKIFSTVVTAVLLSLVGCSSHVPYGNEVSIRLRIIAPTSNDTRVFVAGDRTEFRNWDAQGLPVGREADGSYQAEISLPIHSTLKYKITRGSWSTVETKTDHSDIPDRTLMADSNKLETITVAAFAGGGQEQPKVRGLPSTATGDIHYHYAFHSITLGTDRDLMVWLPLGYHDQPNRRYPVLYLHDGQSCFDLSTSYNGHEWRADETAALLIAAAKIPPLIMVGVSNVEGDRVYEYTPSQVDDKDHGINGGGSELFSQFLITEVKPFIDQTYRTMPDREHTAVAGASLGGLSSLYLGYKHGDVFGSIGVMSPSLWWDDRKLFKEIGADAKALKNERIWLDVGSDESHGMVDDAHALSDILAKRFSGNRSFTYLQAAHAKHNTDAFAARFDQVLLFLYGN